MIRENSPVGSSKSNDLVERSVRDVQGMIRTIRSALEHRWGLKNRDRPPDLDVARGVRRIPLGEVQRRQGRQDGLREVQRQESEGHGHGVRRGRIVEASPRRRPARKMACMWEGGVYLGMKGSTGETMISDGNGVCVTRTVRRKLFEERWDAKNLDNIIGPLGRHSRATTRP